MPQDLFNKLGNQAINVMRTESVKFINKNTPLALRPATNKKVRGRRVRKGRVGRFGKASNKESSEGSPVINQGGNVNLYINSGTGQLPHVGYTPFSTNSVGVANPLASLSADGIGDNNNVNPFLASASFKTNKKKKVAYVDDEPKRTILTDLADEVLNIGLTGASGALYGAIEKGTIEGAKKGLFKGLEIATVGGLLRGVSQASALPLIATGLVGGGLFLAKKGYEAYSGNKMGSIGSFTNARKSFGTFIRTASDKFFDKGNTTGGRTKDELDRIRNEAIVGEGEGAGATEGTITQGGSDPSDYDETEEETTVGQPPPTVGQPPTFGGGTLMTIKKPRGRPTGESFRSQFGKSRSEVLKEFKAEYSGIKASDFFKKLPKDSRKLIRNLKEQTLVQIDQTLQQNQNPTNLIDTFRETVNEMR